MFLDVKQISYQEMKKSQQFKSKEKFRGVCMKKKTIFISDADASY